MSSEPVKIIIEVSGGGVQGVYAGSEERPLASIVIVDHDCASVGKAAIEPLAQFDETSIKTYDGRFPAGWYK